MLAVDGFVHGAHIVGGDFASERVESGLYLRPAPERFGAHQRDGLVGREVVLVVFKRSESECLDGAVSGVGGDHVNLMSIERAIEQAEVHGAGRGGEFQPVGGAQTGKPVGALFEFISDAEAPQRRVRPAWLRVDRCRLRASSPRMTMAKVFSKPSGGATTTL